jgi:hypothetical protein
LFTFSNTPCLNICTPPPAPLFKRAQITALPHGPATGEYVEVATSNKHSVKVTPHHTFPACGGGEVQAHKLKAGDCLHTADGESKVAHATKVRATGETYTIEVEHGNVVVAGGIVTHSRTAGMIKLKLPVPSASKA